jgi:hypothetical protein
MRIFVKEHTHAPTATLACMHAHTRHTHMHVCTHARIHTQVRARTHTHKHTHTHTHTQSCPFSSCLESLAETVNLTFRKTNSRFTGHAYIKVETSHLQPRCPLQPLTSKRVPTRKGSSVQDDARAKRLHQEDLLFTTTATT